ncbi:MAG: IclR family transcriptional regulator [Ignavibacteriales bacterium]
MEDSCGARAVDRALRLLKCFSFEQREMSLADLRKAVGLPKTTVLRLITSLENEGFLVRDRLTQKYRLGIILFQLGNIVFSNLDLRRIALPVMEELSRKTGETINLNICHGNSRLCIEKIEGSHDLRQFVEVGKSLPLYKGASGKTLLAHLPDKEKERVLAEAGDLNKSVLEVLGELETIKKNGCGISRDERVTGAAAVSAPIFNHQGKVVAAITISGATVRFTDDRVEYFVRLITDAARVISSSLGFRGQVVTKG